MPQKGIQKTRLQLGAIRTPQCGTLQATQDGNNVVTSSPSLPAMLQLHLALLRSVFGVHSAALANKGLLELLKNGTILHYTIIR